MTPYQHMIPFGRVSGSGFAHLNRRFPVHPDTGRSFKDPASIPLGYGDWWSLCPDMAQVVTTSTREATAYIDIVIPDPLDYATPEDYAAALAIYNADVDAAKDQSQLDAITALGAWVDETPYLYDNPGAESRWSSSTYAIGDVDYRRITGHVLETKFTVRWAPPFSSRAKIRYETSLNGTPTTHDITYSGSDGVEFGGVMRVIRRVPLDLDPNDLDWIYDPAGEQTLGISTPDTTKGATLIWSSVKRSEDFPA